MSRKYRFVFDAGVPSEVRAEFPEFVEAGPVTISATIARFKLSPEYEVVEDEQDYVLHVRKLTKPRRAA